MSSGSPPPENPFASVISAGGYAGSQILRGTAMNKLVEKDPKSFAHIQEMKEKNNRIMMYAGMAIFGVFLLIILIVVIKGVSVSKSSKHDDDPVATS